MNDDLTPEDPFANGLGDRLQSASDHVAGAGVTRAGVDALVADRHRRSPARLAVGIAAAVALLGGLAAAVATGDDDAQQITAGATTTSAVADPCEGSVPTGPIGWIRLTPAQASTLAVADGSIDVGRGEIRPDRAYQITYDGLAFLGDEVPVGEQLFDLGYADPAAGGQDDYLGLEGLLTAAQAADVERRMFPMLTREQVDTIFKAYPDVMGVPIGGVPMDVAWEYFPGETGADPTDTTTTTTTTTSISCDGDPAPTAVPPTTAPPTTVHP